MRTALIFLLVLQSIMMKAFGQVLLTELDPKNDSLILKYTDQYKSLLPLDSLFSIKASNFYEVIYFNKTSCGHHKEKKFWYLRFNSEALECIEYKSKTRFTNTRDKAVILKFLNLIQQVENQYLLQEDIKTSKCNLDEIFIKENQKIQSFAIGDGGFIYSGIGKISPVWLELINEITMIPFLNDSPKSKRKKITNRKYLKSFKEKQ